MHKKQFLDFSFLNSHISQYMRQNFTYAASDNEKINISTYFNEKLFSGKSIIYIHGFKGFKDWGFVPYLGNYFSENGFFTITFNFSHNGIGDNLVEFDQLGKFAENTYSREVRELSEIINLCYSDFFDGIKINKIGLLGHSRGGAIALLSSKQNKKIDAVALWASIAKLDRYTERQKKEWIENGYLEVLNSRTNQMMRMDIDLLNDLEENRKDKLNIEETVKALHCPLLIVHGDQDLAVPIHEAEQIYSWSDKSKTELYKIYGTGHTFDVAHPFNGTNIKFDRLLDKTKVFFYNNLI